MEVQNATPENTTRHNYLTVQNIEIAKRSIHTKCSCLWVESCRVQSQLDFIVMGRQGFPSFQFDLIVQRKQQVIALINSCFNELSSIQAHIHEVHRQISVQGLKFYTSPNYELTNVAHRWIYKATTLFAPTHNALLLASGEGYVFMSREMFPAHQKMVENHVPVQYRGAVHSRIEMFGGQSDFHCSICMEGRVDGEQRQVWVKLMCEHTFHCKCIVQWFSQSFTCPVCRRDYD